MTQLYTSDSDLQTVPPMSTDARMDETRALSTTAVHEEVHTVLPMSTDARVDETQALLITAVHEERVLVPATAEGTEGTLLSRSASTNGLRIEDLPQSASGPAPKKRKVAGLATISDSISDKYVVFSFYDAFLILSVGTYVSRIG